MVAVTVGRNMHGDSGPAKLRPAIDSPAQAVSGDRSLRVEHAQEHRAGSGANPTSDVEAIASTIQARRDAMRREASAQTVRIREIAVARYESETRDAAWAFAQTRARAGVAKELSAAGVDMPADLATDCKRTVCRTTATFENRGQADQWTLLYMASLGNVAKTSVVSHSRDAQGADRLDIYSISDR